MQAACNVSAHDLPTLPCRRTLGRPPLGGPHRALRRPLPRRPRRLDGRRRPPVDPGRPRPDQLAAAVDRLGLRARLRRPAAARRARRRPAGPPAHADRGAGRVHRRVRARRARRRRHRARHHPLHQGHGRGVHRPRRPVDHHHDVRRGPGAQQGADDLHRDRRERVLARPRVRRAADRDRLALDVPAPRPRRARAADRRAARDPSRPPARSAPAARFDIPGAVT